MLEHHGPPPSKSRPHRVGARVCRGTTAPFSRAGKGPREPSRTAWPLGPARTACETRAFSSRPLLSRKRRLTRIPSRGPFRDGRRVRVFTSPRRKPDGAAATSRDPRLLRCFVGGQSGLRSALVVAAAARLLWPYGAASASSLRCRRGRRIAWWLRRSFTLDVLRIAS